MKIVLASQSPRRKKFLEKRNFNFIIDPANIDERAIKIKDVSELSKELAIRKAQTVAKRHPNAIIIAADNIVYIDNIQYGKAGNDISAEEILRNLMGKTHEIYCGICIINTNTNEMKSSVEVAKLTLKTVSDDVLKAYIKTKIWEGKAGAYNIDDLEFKPFVEKVEGDVNVITGMPLKVIDIIETIK